MLGMCTTLVLYEQIKPSANVNQLIKFAWSDMGLLLDKNGIVVFSTPNYCYQFRNMVAVLIGKGRSSTKAPDYLYFLKETLNTTGPGKSN